MGKRSHIPVDEEFDLQSDIAWLNSDLQRKQRKDSHLKASESGVRPEKDTSSGTPAIRMSISSTGWELEYRTRARRKFNQLNPPERPASPAPPANAVWILDLLLEPKSADVLIGDLEEAYKRRRKRYPKQLHKADWWYRVQVGRAIWSLFGAKVQGFGEWVLGQIIKRIAR